MKKIIIYLGPSLPLNKAEEILKADYRPPVKRNDVLKSIDESPDIIGIIDGVFHQSPAVSHKEILKAIEKGITVVGGSSMGALRASELDSLGMKGIGYVYKQYAEGEIESDDDVSLTFTSDDYTPVSEALINVEYNLNTAEKQNIINSEDKKEILKASKSIYYPLRTYPKILSKSKISDETKDKFKEFLKIAIDIKQQDAIDLLKYIKEL
ncbi:TfuA-related McrA-glycine thioamidation protein [Methanobrevibacter filiformis]|uniref:TfuA-like protein n=1 Tax=Methanobrevibacter filiformis TaxID=55758 RepID=A0A166C6W6_9EURY|nr:TfuA-related McrA-glycine thioamidation protein [Methanobrevibacter filiformis]KZX11767.1 TfuA-like protein [Methanobrevibacter filiformis]